MTTNTQRALTVLDIKRHAANLAKGAEQERMLRHDVIPLWGSRSAEEITGRDAVDLYERVAKRAPQIACAVGFPGVPARGSGPEADHFDLLLSCANVIRLSRRAKVA